MIRFKHNISLYKSQAKAYYIKYNDSLLFRNGTHTYIQAQKSAHIQFYVLRLIDIAKHLVLLRLSDI